MCNEQILKQELAVTLAVSYKICAMVSMNAYDVSMWMCIARDRVNMLMQCCTHEVFVFVGTRRRLGASPIEAIDRCGFAGFLRVLLFSCHHECDA